MTREPVIACFDDAALAFAGALRTARTLRLAGAPSEDYRRLTALLAEGGADENRVYAVALGDGVAAACAFAAAHPRDVAAALLAGGGDPRAAEALRDMPIRMLAGERGAREPMAVALRGAGSRLLEVAEPGDGAEQALREAGEWLLRQDLRDRLSVRWLQPGLWNIESEKIDSFYLVEGTDKALAIDTGMGRTPVMPLLRGLTNRPVELALTHAHDDHLYHADEFERRYISPLERELLPVFATEKGYRMQDFAPIGEGDTLSLGGNDIGVIGLPGHTPGSLVFVDHAHRCLFTGDAFGSGIGVLMSIAGALPIARYREELVCFRRKIEPYKEYAMYGGHRAQETGEPDGSYSYHPLCVEVVDDMIALCQKLLDGEKLPYEAQTSPWVNEPVRYARYGKAAMWVAESQCGRGE